MYKQKVGIGQLQDFALDSRNDEPTMINHLYMVLNTLVLAIMQLGKGSQCRHKETVE